MDLNGKRAFVTGGTGFIGGRLAERLMAEEDMVVRVLARDPDKGQRLAQLGAEVVHGDITNVDSLQQAVAGCDLVFHNAAWVSEKGTKAKIYAVNVAGTENVINAAQGVERFIHLSSCAVYGSLQQFDIDETVPARLSHNLYANSKVLAEKVVQAGNVPYVIVRPSQVYGPHSYQFSIRPVELIKAKKMVLVDNGRYLCKPVYIDNLIDGLILSAKVDAAVGHVINITDDKPIPWQEFFGAYGRMVGVASFPSVPFFAAWLIGLLNEIRTKIQRKESGLNRRVVRGLRSRNSFSNQKARDLLGWTTTVDFAEGMRRTEAWLRAEGYI